VNQIDICAGLLEDNRHHLRKLQSGEIRIRRYDNREEADVTAQEIRLCKGTIALLEHLYELTLEKICEEDRHAKRLVIFERITGLLIPISAFAVMLVFTGWCGMQGEDRWIVSASVPLAGLLLKAKDWSLAVTVLVVVAIYTAGPLLLGA